MRPNRRAQDRERADDAVDGPPTVNGSPRPLLRWYGPILVAIETRPFALSLLTVYAPLVIIAYSALIGVASFQHWLRLDTWLDIWLPTVNFLRDVIPVFKRLERVLVLNNYVGNTAAIDHLIAFAWFINPPIFVFVSLVILNLTDKDWDRFVGLVPPYLIGLGSFACPVFTLAGLAVAIFGARLHAPPLYFAYRYIFLFYVGVTCFGVISVITLCAVLGEKVGRTKNRI
jgi:hypothetical protein